MGNGKFFLNNKGSSDPGTEAVLAINAAQSDREAGGTGVVDIIADGEKIGQVSIHGDPATLAQEIKDQME